MRQARKSCLLVRRSHERAFLHVKAPKGKSDAAQLFFKSFKNLENCIMAQEGGHRHFLIFLVWLPEGGHRATYCPHHSARNLSIRGNYWYHTGLYYFKFKLMKVIPHRRACLVRTVPLPSLWEGYLTRACPRIPGYIGPGTFQSTANSMNSNSN